MERLADKAVAPAKGHSAAPAGASERGTGAPQSDSGAPQSDTDALEPDPIPNADVLEIAGPDDTGMTTCRFLAFNTAVELQAFGPASACRSAFLTARDASRAFERLFSRTLPHSDIARLNAARGRACAIAPETADLLEKALSYCADSEGRFDITMGSAVRLWDLRRGIVPSREALAQACRHVDWRGVRVWEENDTWHAQLCDPDAVVDAGGIAKGWIADALAQLLVERGIGDFIVNLGGNVVAHGEKPGGAPWRIGVRNPREKEATVGSFPLLNASAVTSGIYERCCTVEGRFFHHILSPETGMPADTDTAGVTVIARRSIDAEGYSTTLLALGSKRGAAFARKHSVIEAAFFVLKDGTIVEA